MRQSGRTALILAALSCAACVSAKPAEGPVLELTDLIESAGITLPKGEELAKLVASADEHPLGSKLNPVRADSPGGQRAYLARLRCPDGRAPKSKRAFSAGIGPFGRMIDEYQVTCAGSAQPIYLDMYHPGHVETRAVAGYSIRQPR